LLESLTYGGEKKLQENFSAKIFSAKFVGWAAARRRYLDRAAAISIQCARGGACAAKNAIGNFDNRAAMKILNRKLLDKSASLGKMSQQLSVAA
jgi:hypothetical protein